MTAFPPGGHLGASPGVTVELERIVPTGSVTHYLWLEGRGREEVLEGLRADPSVEALDVLDDLDDRTLVRVHWEGIEMPLHELVVEEKAVLVDARGAADGWTVTLRFPDRDALIGFYEAYRERGLGLDLRRINESGLGESDDDYGVTPVQRETITAAFQMGYFEVPRGTTLAELSGELGVSEQAVSERLRRALGKYLDETLHDGRSSGPNRHDPDE